jgi:hypothetical protein
MPPEEEIIQDRDVGVVVPVLIGGFLGDLGKIMCALQSHYYHHPQFYPSQLTTSLMFGQASSPTPLPCACAFELTEPGHILI